MASSNVGKIREISRLLKDFDVEVVAQTEYGVIDADESGQSFRENSLIKAQHAARLTGLPAIADDSGLAVKALDGAPGIYSARFAGEHGDDTANNAKLLQMLEEVDDRAAVFHCVATFVNADYEPLVAEGLWSGEILREQHGEGGFGYDPLFFIPSYGCSSAELSMNKKNAISHRGQALRQLVELIKQTYA
ncbi:MAG: RdgB/HAM1 family non-canonical purine NTP pyrophosphatase [Woeseiaceae bacterium]|jgi:XTP/dITP diphosphohydrolase|nr:RdgB/HAM1 family non-canonical purine NTP pyrophosphatase [Woeseiaceae bacterium]